MNDPDYGRKIGSALKAVQCMHQDAVSLILYVDDLLAGMHHPTSLESWTNVHKSVITDDLSWTVKRGFYMAEGLFRHNIPVDSAQTSGGRVRALTIAFFDSSSTRLTEPVVIATEFHYLSKWPTTGTVESVWDGWDAYFESAENSNSDRPLQLTRENLSPKLGHIASGSLLARRLYSFSSRTDVESFCREAWVESAT